MVSTMNRSNLEFLNSMFPFANFSLYNLIIVNQTSETKLLISDFPNVKVINSFEKGLSKSRNLGLKNATAKIILIADDDVVFIPNFDEIIISSYNKNSIASIICFQTLTTENRPFSSYNKESFEMNNVTIKPVLSIEISFKTENILAKGCLFNENFGLGAQFQDAESLFFLRKAIHKKSKVYFEPKTIVIHEKFSSSDDVSSDRLIYAKMASFYKRFGVFSYLLLHKYIFFLIRKKIIRREEIKRKFKIGLKGIQDYKKMVEANLEHKYD